MRFERQGVELTLAEFEKFTGAKWVSALEIEEKPLLLKLGLKLHKKGDMSREQLWLGKYYQKEILLPPSLDVTIRWIDPSLGWGVFANRPIAKGQFITEYTGKVRKRKRADAKNGYCFEYSSAQDLKTAYLIDAREQGGISRYINHSHAPNLQSALATFDGLSHVIFYAKEPIAKEAQLCYDYGPDYWSKRAAPVSL